LKKCILGFHPALDHRQKMKLVGFSANNYRSISNAYKLPLNNYTVIVGPNNEGKSNVLKALALALTLLTGSKPIRPRRIGTLSYGYRSIERFDYDWERDFPINQQNTKPNGKSEFTCEFELTDGEFEDFRKATGVNLTTNLRAKVSIGKEDIKFDFLMKGKGKQTLTQKREVISRFINSRLMIQYIPAIRTSELAISIVENLLEKELSTLEKNTEFLKIIKSIEKIQQPILKKIAKSLKDSISGFIPDIKNISIKNRENVGRLIGASCKVYINDGIETELRFKGDGVISLTAISLLQHFSKQGSLDKELILLLEEPESHLHPKAIHSLKKVLNDISSTNQVILTTHSPIIIDRLQVKHNIIVQNGKVVQAEKINQIRESLGITMSDNLSSAYLVLLVEGEEDIILLKPWIEAKSTKIKAALENGSLIIDHLGGASNIGYKASLYKSNLCNVYAYLDDDEAGRKGILDAEKKSIIKANEYTLSFCKGMGNSELEDLINVNAYKQLIIDDYGVDLSISSFRNSSQQWSNRVRDTFKLHGKIWNEKQESELKHKVAKVSAALKLSSLDDNKANPIDALVSAMELVLEKVR